MARLKKSDDIRRRGRAQAKRSRGEPDLPMRQFASDNYAGICPEALEAIQRANAGHARAYGDDVFTARACELLREFFETDCEVFFVFNGTAANSLALASLCQSYHSVICHEIAHVEVDECGAPEFFSNGSKILLASGQNGKFDLRDVERVVTKRSDIHFPKARVLSLTQATEVGTVYSIAELKAMSQLARRLGLRFHMDGARLANALVTLGCSPAEATWKAGVEVLCLGGTKNGLPVGDAVLFFDREAAREFDYRCKQAGQLASKMRFLSAPWIGLIESGAMMRNAESANRHAEMLARELKKISGVKVMFPRQANAVFVEMPPAAARRLHEWGWHFYSFIGEGGARFMCSWDTTEEDVKHLADELRRAVAELR